MDESENDNTHKDVNSQSIVDHEQPHSNGSGVDDVDNDDEIPSQAQPQSADGGVLVVQHQQSLVDEANGGGGGGGGASGLGGGKELELDVNIHDEGVMGLGDDPSLYDDVMINTKAEPRGIDQEDQKSPSDSNNTATPALSVATATGVDKQQSQSQSTSAAASNPSGGIGVGSTITSTSSSASTTTTMRRVCCYVGNLTWWTNDRDMTDAIVHTLGVSDLVDIKFYENKVNGQSKGFALVTVGSDASFRTLIDKLPKVRIHDHEPVVTPFSRHYFAQFEEQARKEFPPATGNTGQADNYQHHHHQQQHNPSMQPPSQLQQQQYYMNRNRTYTNNQGPNNGIGLPLARPPGGGGGLMGAPNGVMQRQGGGGYNASNGGAGLVGPYPGTSGGQVRASQQQTSLLGNTPPGMMPIRPPQPGGAPYVRNAMMQPQSSQQQTSLLGNRPTGMMMPQGGAVVQSQQPPPQQQQGLLQMRPGMAPIAPGGGVVPNPVVSPQTPGLLSNPPGMVPPSRMGPGGAGGAGVVVQPQPPSLAQQQSLPNSWDARTNPALVNGAGGLMNPNAAMLNQRGGPNIAATSAVMPQQANPYALQNPHHQYHHTQAMNGAVGLIGAPPSAAANQHHIYMQQQHHHQQQPQQLPQSSHHHHNQYGMTAQQTYHMHLQQQQQQQQQQTTMAPSAAMMTMMAEHVQQQQAYNRQSSSSSSSGAKMTELEFQDALEKNRIISSQAISRAVQDASIGQYASAIETLVTAISLIKQSKVGYDERCKIFAASLEDTKQGIEDKYYGSLNLMQQQQQHHQHRVMYAEEVGSGGESRERSPQQLQQQQQQQQRRYERSRTRSRSRSRSRDRDRSDHRDTKHHRRGGGGGGGGGGESSSGSSSKHHHHRSSRRERDRSRSRSRSDRRQTDEYHRSSRH